jgi:predicted nuclease with TOPRIM domain
MAEVTLDLIQELCQRILTGQREIGRQLDELRTDVQEIKGRVSMLEQQYASLSHRIDRLGGSQLRIERRLGLIDDQVIE